MQRTKFLLRPVRTQQTLIPRAMAQAATPVVQRRLMREMSNFAHQNIIPRLQYEYKRNPEGKYYERKVEDGIYGNWTVNVNLSHGAIAAVFSNNARDRYGRTYWSFVQGSKEPHLGQPGQNQKIHNLRRWNTLEQILASEREDIRDRAQRVFNDLLGV